MGPLGNLPLQVEWSALTLPGTPEVRQYRLRYWDKGTPNGDWTEVATITVGP